MDPIADMLTKIRNAGAVGKKTVSIPYTVFKYELGKILEKQGFIDKMKKRGRDKKKIVLALKYDDNQKTRINEIKRISKPGRRIYFNRKKLYLPKNGYGMLVVSTSKGLLTSKEAKEKNLGGEAICEVW
jgi:small subunit ribosomal protein S8